MRLLSNIFQPRDRRRFRQVTASAAFVDILESRLLLTAVNLADEEQLILELINRARANPNAEAARLGISLNAGLPAGTISSTPKQPLAPNQQLQNASVAHSLDMIERDFFAHTNPSGVTPGGRATAAGYDWWTIAENIAYIGYFGNPDINANTREAHDLLFQSAGHRTNILMSEVEEIGIGIRSGAYAPAGSNATLVTENFGRRNLNPIITGVVYSDTNNSDFYDIGEAVRSGTITARRVSDGATFSDNIGISGGFGLIVPAGSYVVTAAFTRNGTPVSMTSNVIVSTENVKVDFDATTAVVVELALSAPTLSMTETGATSSLLFSVTRSGSTSGALTVNLNSSDTTEITVPTSIIIPDGQSTASFTAVAVNDGLLDGTQFANVQTSAVGAVTVSQNVRITDMTAPSFSASEITTTVLRPTLSWIGISNATRYEVLVTQIAAGSPVILRQSNVAATSITMPVDLPLGNYYFQVRGITAAGLISRWSSLQIVRSRPLTVVEGAGRTETSGTFTIRWAAVPGAAVYDIAVDRLTSQTSGFLRNTSVATNSLTVSDFPIGQYQVRVRSQSAGGQISGWSPTAIITVNIRPTGLNVTADAFGTPTTLNWTAVPGAVRYDVHLDDRISGATKIFRDANVVGTSLTLPTLATGSYAAYVRAVDAANRTHFISAPCNFMFNSAPRLTYSAGTVPGRPLLSWTTVAGAARYELVFANASLIPQVTLSDLNGNQYQPTEPLTAGSWRAWIRAFDSQGGITSNSNIVTFVVASSEPGPRQDLPPLAELQLHAAGDVMGPSSEFTSPALAVRKPQPRSETEESFDAQTTTAATGEPMNKPNAQVNSQSDPIGTAAKV